ncbi:hypothetical protein [Cohnella abietis]|uniref:Uncharacterized protein n=1 Tax=Cohnella abietis TaxID=2507935 RepID=A0A3T1DA22_9BACL|nr:hypothetical protein [Cohnella abietis]BBI34952.1 hypothetical protein KCTCHS21_43510 [Cohnella abietis]
MKKWFAIMVFTTFVTVGCSNETREVKPTSEAKQTEQAFSPTSTSAATNTVKEEEAPDPSEIVKKFYEAYIKKDYDTLPQYIEDKNLGMSAADFIKNLKESDFKNSADTKEYMISQIADYDDTHKYAKVLVKGKNANGDVSGENRIGLVLVNGEWKLDFVLLIEKSNLDKQITTENKVLTVTSVEQMKRMDGFNYVIQLKNNQTDNQVSVGWLNEATAELTTDKGNVTSKLSRATIKPNSNGSITIFFETQKAEANSLQINGLQITDSKNLPIQGKDPFSLVIPLK